VGRLRARTAATLAALLLAAACPAAAATGHPYLVLDVNPGATGSGVFTAAAAGAQLYFRANDGTHGEELWKSDGTGAGTTLVDDTCPGACDSKPDQIMAAGAGVYFTGNDGVDGYEPFVSLPETGVTNLDINPNPMGDSSPRLLAPLGGALLLTANDGGTQIGLFSATGAAATFLGPVTPSSNLAFHGVRFWFGGSGGAGIGLWSTDGSPAGTVLVKDFVTSGGSAPSSLAAYGGALWFSGDDGSSGEQLWRSNGTDAGTALFKTINAGGWASPRFLTAAGGVLFFSADDGVHGRELWACDSTADGTALVMDINPAGGSDPQALVAAGDLLFFTADDGVHGRELWVSNGTPEGTALVRDIQAAAGVGAEPAELTALGSKLVFTANSGALGRQLWVSDGTAAGTDLIDVTMEGDAEGPSGLTLAGSLLFFQANDGPHGRELWALPTGEFVTRPDTPAAPGPVTTGTPATFTSGGSQTLLGHPVEYRFSWGDGTYSDWSATPSAEKTWLVEGWMNVTVEARCAAEPGVVSSPSKALALQVGLDETVATPAVDGPVAGDLGVPLSFGATGASSSIGHALQYRFFFGDGEDSGWVDPPAEHSWSLSGDFEVTVEARCASHIWITSAASAPHALTISPQEIVTAPTAVAGPVSVTPGTHRYTASGGASNRGHAIEYGFDAGAGIAWRPAGTAWADVDWGSTGTFSLYVWTRCAEHTGKVSQAAFGLPVVVETVTAADPPADPGEVEAGPAIDVGVGGGASALGHALEHRVDWGDGTIGDWETGSPRAHAWAAAGTYAVRAQARCADHPGIESPWSAATDVAVDKVPDPGPIAGPVEAETGATVDFSVPALTTGLGHAVEYLFSWGDGTDSGWISANGASHAWASPNGPTTVQVDARCAASGIFATNPATAQVVVHDPESVTAPGTPWWAGSGEPVWWSQTPYAFATDASAASSLGHALEHRFDWGDGTFSAWSAGLTATVEWAAPGTWPVRAQARCAAHLVESPWSAARDMVVGDIADNLPVAVFNASPADPVCPAAMTFTAGTQHRNPSKHIVTWEWDLAYDGVTFRPWFRNSFPILQVDVGTIGFATAALRVTDDNAPPNSAIATQDVAYGGNPPVANAGGTGGVYTIAAGDRLALSAALSNPGPDDRACGDRIVSWEWDLDGDGDFDDALGEKPVVAWADFELLACGGACGPETTYPVAVRVTDAEGKAADSPPTNVLVRAATPVKLVSPNGAEFFPNGEWVAVRWLAPPAADRVALWLGTGTTFKPVAFTDLDLDTGKASWQVPASYVTTGRAFKLKVAAYAGTTLLGSDTSNAPFALGPLDLTFPESGAVVAGGRSVDVTWDLAGAVAANAAVVKYTVDGGATWKTAVGTLKADATGFTWSVPALPTRKDKCRLQVQLKNNATLVAKDSGATWFSILGAVDVTFPEAGAQVWGNTLREVTWATQTAAAVDETRVYLTTNGGSSWLAGPVLAGNPGRAAVKFPDVGADATKCKVKVVLRYRGRTVAQDTGAATFTILALP
jgi:ELWxxDGT repeat protein